MLDVVLFLLSATSVVQGACNPIPRESLLDKEPKIINYSKKYQIGKVEIKTCKGEPVDHWTLSEIGAEFTDECSILAKGCAKIHTELQYVVTEYKAFKDGVEISKGRYEICDMTLFDTKFVCPIEKGKTFCSTKNWVTKVPKTLLPMAVGNISSEVSLKTSAGVFCYIIKSRISRK